MPRKRVRLYQIWSGIKQRCNNPKCNRYQYYGAKGIKSVSGLGLMIGIECEKSAADVIEKCRDRGVLVIKAKHKVRWNLSR